MKPDPMTRGEWLEIAEAHADLLEWVVESQENRDKRKARCLFACLMAAMTSRERAALVEDSE